MKRYFYFLLFLFCGCTMTERKVPLVSFDIDQGKTGDVSEVFEDRKIVFLETLEESLLTEVTKIICAEDRIYILDEPANSIVVFDTTGKFISAIRPSGRGPQEYMGISDFTINREKGQLIVHAHRPGKLLFFNLDCRFQNEIPYKSLVSAMSWKDGQLILVNSLQENSPYFTFLSFNDKGEISEKRVSSFKEKINSNQYTVGSLLLNGEKMTFARRFDNTLYSLEGDRVIPRYILDFNGYNVPVHLLAPREEEEEKRAELRKGNYFFSIVNVKETPSSVFFKNNGLGLMRLSKESGRGDYWVSLKDSELGISSGNMVGVEDLTNRLFCFEYPLIYVQLSIKGQWERFPEWFAEKLKRLGDESNPFLIFYTSKE